MSELIKLERTPEELSQAVLDNITSAVASRKIEGRAKSIVVSDIKISGGNHTHNELAHLVSSKKSAHAKMTGTINLVDNRTGKTVETQKGAFLGNIPVMTRKGAFVVKGSSYVVPHQMRLRPGAYTSIKQNGDTETMFNPSSGTAMKIVTPGNKNEMAVQLGGRKFNALDVLSILGKSPESVKKELGNSIYSTIANKSRLDKTTVSLAEKLKISVPQDAAHLDQTREQIRDYFGRTRVDPNVMSKTLGIKSHTIDANVMLRAMKKNADVSSRRVSEDDKENLTFKKIMTPESLITEGVMKKMDTELYRVKGKLNSPIPQKISQIMDSPLVGNKPADFITTSSLSRMPEEYNSLQTKQIRSDITPLGEGGIMSSEMITPSVRSLHNSQLGFIDPIKSPEGANTGVTLSLAKGAYLDAHGTPHIKVKNLKTGKKEIVSISDMWDKKLAFPDPSKDGSVGMRIGTDIVKGNIKNADYQISHASDMYGPGMNSLGAISSNDPTRNLMASKHVLQALPLTHREVSGVGLTGENGSMTNELGREGLPVAFNSGVVTKIDKKKGMFSIKGKDGNVSKVSFASDPIQMNSKTYIEHMPIVSVGQSVKKGDVLADSNQTKGGKLALGTNVRTAWMMYPGTRNDAVVISEDAAKKFTSEHSAKFDIDDKKDGFMDKKRFMSLFPEIALKHNMDNYDDSGVVKPGVVLAKGDPVAFRGREIDKHEAKFENTKIKKMLYGGFVPEVHEWKYKNPGTLSTVKKNGNQLRIVAKYEAPAEIGDKLSGRSGNKGIISQIVPVKDMPHDEHGKPIDVILGGASVISRQNPAQIIEAALGSVAKKTGKAYDLDHYTSKNLAGFAKSEAEKHGVQLYHTITDPVRKITLDKPIFVGDYNMMKLFKQGETAWSAVGHAGADGLKQPKKGGKESASGISNMEINSLLAHGAKDFLREVYDVRSQENKEWFHAFESGKPLPKAESKTSVGRFNTYMKQMGINMQDTGDSRILLPMTDKDVLALSSGIVKSGTGLKRNTMDPQSGGIYDTKIFGHSGTQYGHIDVKEKFLNPMYQSEIGKMIGKTSSEVDGMVASGKTDELYSIVKGMSIPNAIANQKKMLKGTNDAGNANKIVRTIKTLKKFESQKIRPSDAMFISKIPVLPILSRPIAKLPDGNMLNHDVNIHYKSIIDATSILSDAKKDGAPEGILRGLRSEVQKTIGAMYGTNESPDPKIRQKGIKGMIDIVGGSNPKTSFWHQNVLKNKVYSSGRAVVTPHNKSLGMDQAEIPKDIAWKMFEPHVTRKLTMSGVPINDAKDRIKNRDRAATYALKDVMSKVPIVINRAPSLHKHNFTAHYARIGSGNTMNVPAEIEPMHNMDYDGDALGIHVPLGTAAIKDAKTKLLPSKQLFSAAGSDALIAGIDLDPFIGFYEGSKKYKKGRK